MPSPRFAALAARIGEIRKHLLPDPFNPTGTYADPQEMHSKSLAFLVLTHAEIEAYLEDRCVELSGAAVTAWQATRKVSAPLVGLLAFSGIEHGLPPEKILAPGANRPKFPVTATEALEKCLAIFTHAAKSNNGVKEKDLRRMFMPLGLDDPSIGTTLMADLDSFGRTRGEAAHVSQLHVTTLKDPQSEYNRVVGLLTLIEGLDTQLDALRATF